MNELKHCILCGEPTNGSIGAAGLVWTNCCQNCKNHEDEALAFRVKNQDNAMKLVLQTLGLGELSTRNTESVHSEPHQETGQP